MSDDGKTPSYTVSIKGPGLSVETSVNLSTALSLTRTAMGVGEASEPEQQNTKPEKISLVEDDIFSAGGRPLSLREYLNSVRAIKNAEKITALGEYLISREGVEGFTWEDVKARFKPAGEAVPANFSRDFAIALKAGWVSERPQLAGSFYVTQTGRSAIENLFGRSLQKPAPSDAKAVPGTSSEPQTRRRKGGAKTANWRIAEDFLTEGERADLKAFYDSKSPKSQNEQVSVLVFKLKDMKKGEDGFDGHQMHTAFQAVGVRTPGNLSAVFKNMTTAGLGRVADKRLMTNFKADDLVKHSLPHKEAADA